MALKITTQIGTDLGITKEAYIRITSYEISKYGQATFRYETFLNAAAAKGQEISPGMYHEGQRAQSQQISTQLMVPMMKKVMVTEKQLVTEERPVYADEPIPNTDPQEYNKVQVRTETFQVEKDVEVEREVPCLDEVVTEGFTTFGYRHLREKLQAIFGKANVIDC
jgi:hypothetical protein